MQNQAGTDGKKREREGGKYDDFCLQAQNSNYSTVWQVQTTSHDSSKTTSHISSAINSYNKAVF